MATIARPNFGINRWFVIGVGLLAPLAVLPIWVAYGALVPEEGGHGGMMVDTQEWLARASAYADEHRLEDGTVLAVPGEPIPIAALQYAWIPRLLKMQTGEEYHIQLVSLDVIHGFSLQMGGTSLNASVMPGMISTIELIPTQPGEYLINCNEYCGVGHQAMSARFIVEGEPISRGELAPSADPMGGMEEGDSLEEDHDQMRELADE